MHLDIQLLYLFIGVGLISSKLSWRGWFAISMTIFAWMMYNWLRG